jgi:hypothetical protein
MSASRPSAAQDTNLWSIDARHSNMNSVILQFSTELFWCADLDKARYSPWGVDGTSLNLKSPLHPNPGVWYILKLSASPTLYM